MPVRKGVEEYILYVSRYIILGAARANFTLEIFLAMSNVSNAPKKIDEALVPHAQSSFTNSTKSG